MRDVAARELFEDEGGVEAREGRAADVFLRVDGPEAEFGEGGERRAIERAFSFPPCGMRGEAFFGETLCGFDDEGLFFG